jgi:hypothetical protein
MKAGALYEHLRTFMIFSSILLRMLKVSEESFGEKAHFLFSITFSPENRAVCEIMWKKMSQQDWPQMKI